MVNYSTLQSFPHYNPIILNTPFRNDLDDFKASFQTKRNHRRKTVSGFEKDGCKALLSRPVLLIIRQGICYPQFSKLRSHSAHPGIKSVW